MNQGKFYDSQYDDRPYGVLGLPDKKIVDYKSLTGKKMLSIGGGMGADLWWLANDNDAYILDSSRAAARIAEKHGLKAKVADVSRPLPYPDKSFDIVILKDILEHLVEPMRLLLEAKRVMKNDGDMIISLPNHFYLWFRLRILFGKNLLWRTIQHDHTRDQNEWDYMHVRFFTWQGVQRMMKVAGLKVDKGYWDFGTLAHYSDPEMFYEAIKDKQQKSGQAKIFLSMVYPVYRIFNAIFPKNIRSRIVAWNPGLLCAGFYIRVKKIQIRIYRPVKRGQGFKNVT